MIPCHPFGMPMPGRSLPQSNYRFGFNGKENDNEVKGSGNQQDYGMRIYDPRLGRFLSMDPLLKNYPWYSSYQFSGNSPVRFVDLDGMEEANPSIFRKAWNLMTGNREKNRLDNYLTENKLTSDDVVELSNDTYVVVQIKRNASTGMTYPEYSIFRQFRRTKSGFGYGGEHNDDIGLSQEQFLKTDVLGEDVLPAPFIFGAGKSAGMALNGAKYSFRAFVGFVGRAGKELSDWRSHIKFGVLDAIGSSKDLLKKGFHFHFTQLSNLELSLQYVEDAAKNGQIALGFIIGKQELIADAIKVFNRAMKNEKFVNALMVRLKAAQETLNDASKVLRNADEVKMATERAEEIGKIIKAMQK